MPGIPRPKLGGKAPAPHSQTSPKKTDADPDMETTLLEAIRRSEQNVLKRIDSMDKSVESLSGKLHKKIDNLSTEI